MASELSTPGWEHVGDVDVMSTFGDPAKSLGVWRRRSDGAVNLDVPYSDIILPAEALAAFTGLLQRAAMPGQPPAAAAGPLADAPGTGKTEKQPLYGCCPHCEHCGAEACQEVRARHCPHGSEQPPHREPCAWEDCEPGHKATAEAVITERATP